MQLMKIMHCYFAEKVFGYNGDFSFTDFKHTEVAPLFATRRHVREALATVVNKRVCDTLPPDQRIPPISKKAMETYRVMRGLFSAQHIVAFLDGYQQHRSFLERCLLIPPMLPDNKFLLPLAAPDEYFDGSHVIKIEAPEKLSRDIYTWLVYSTVGRDVISKTIALPRMCVNSDTCKSNDITVSQMTRLFPGIPTISTTTGPLKTIPQSTTVPLTYDLMTPQKSENVDARTFYHFLYHIARTNLNKEDIASAMSPYPKSEADIEVIEGSDVDEDQPYEKILAQTCDTLREAEFISSNRAFHIPTWSFYKNGNV